MELKLGKFSNLSKYKHLNTIIYIINYQLQWRNKKLETINCKHANIKKIATKESIYTYKISSEEEISLCPDCNMNLAGEIAKQQAIETFINEFQEVNKNRNEK